MPQANTSSKSRTVKIVLLAVAGLLMVFVLIVAGLITVGLHVVKKLESKYGIPGPQAEDIAKAQGSGMSMNFIVEAWPAYKLTGNNYMRMNDLPMEKGIVFPPDDEMRRVLLKSRKAIHTPTDQLTYDRLHALLWLNHVAPRYGGAPGFASLGDIHNHCFIAVVHSFANDKQPADVARNTNACPAEQKRILAQVEKAGDTQFDDF